MPSGIGCDEVRRAEEVERAAKDEPRDAVRYRPVPCYLWSVDAEMRRDGTIETLLREDVMVLRLLGYRGSCCESNNGGSVPFSFYLEKN